MAKVEFIYYFNPKPHQNIDGDGIPEPFVVDDEGLHLQQIRPQGLIQLPNP